MRKTGWIVMTVLASIIAAYALAVLLVPGFGPPFIAERRAVMPVAVIAHLAGGAVALGVGAWQFNAGVRARHLAVHRWMGRTYVVAVLAGGLGALSMAPVTQFGMATHVGFGLLAVCWLLATVTAWTYIRGGDQIAHRRWMIRSYALTLAAVTLRIYLPLALRAGLPFDTSYQAIAWACWVPNLIVAEWLLLEQPRRPRPRAA